MRCRLSNKARAIAEYAAVCAFALGWFVQRTGGAILDPGHTAWMLSGDWAATYHGWLMHIGGDWTLPPGLTPDLLYPWGTSVFYTNSVYWLALVGKLVEPLVGRPFQLYGLYVALSFVGLGVVSLWLFRSLRLSTPARIAGAALMVMSPVVVARFGHLALTAHWIVLLQIALAIDTVANPEHGRRNVVFHAAGVMFAVGLEAYLVAISMPVALAGLCIARVRGRVAWVRLGASAAAMIVGVGLMLWIVGAFTGGPVNRTAEGFGDFSADLTTLFNSIGISRWVPAIPVRPRQGEGFGYLGLGVLILAAVAVAGAIRGGRSTGRAFLYASPLIVVCVAEAFYALSPRISWAGQPVAEWRAPFDLLGPLPSMFRTSGRFIWPLHWIIAVGAVLGTFRLFGPKWSALPLVAAVVIQAVEIPERAHVFNPPRVHQMGVEWQGVGKHYRHIQIVPIQVQWICPYNEGLVSGLTRVAYEEDMTINSGLVGRSPEVVSTLCHTGLTEPIRDDTIYVVNPAYLPQFANGGACGVVDRVHVCVSSARDTPLAGRLRR